MKFTKMQGIGNDYVYVDGAAEQVADPASLAKKIADRHFGVGSDGLILVLPSTTADVKMRMFNADGSESEMCGNGIRCVAKFAFDHGLTKKNPLTVETGAGVKSITLSLTDGKVSAATVDMGVPILKLEDIPVSPNAVSDHGNATYRFAAKPGTPRPQLFEATFVSMGNPHAVIFVDDVASVDVATLGPLIETGAPFPRKINVHWVQVNSANEVTMRTWERGSGITLACGTGACAVAVAGVLTGKTGRNVLAHLPGGDLQLEWREADGHVYMTGPAVEVFSGVWEN